jgi:hypothetical protein
MSTVLNPATSTRGIGSTTRAAAASDSPARQAYRILQAGFIAAPIIAGLDKFFHLLVDWDKYLPGIANRMVGGHGHQLMLAVGVIEIAAGIGVALRPRVFSYVVAAWLWVIILNLLLIPGYFDVALRDFGLSLAALALGRLSAQYSAR